MKLKLYFLILFIIVSFFILSTIIVISRNEAALSREVINDNLSPVIIVDPGHGGVDGGAIGADGTYEKHLNLIIAQKLNDILNLSGIKTIMIRNDDVSIHNNSAKTIREKKVSDLHNRLKIIEETQNAIFISIHQNSFENSKYYGSEVFYSPNNAESKKLAGIIQNNIIQLLQPSNTRVIKKADSSIFILYKAKKTAVMIECGFISNIEEVNRLKAPEYQQKMAFAIFCGILNYVNSLEEN